MPKDKLMYLGNRIRSARKSCALTQQELENGRKNPSYETLSLLIDRLGITPNSLFPDKVSSENEIAQRVIGKLQSHNKENQEILLRTMGFLSEQLLNSQHKNEPKGSE